LFFSGYNGGLRGQSLEFAFGGAQHMQNHSTSKSIIDLTPGHSPSIKIFLAGLFLVVGFAFIVRLVWNLNVHTYPISDFAWYHERAIGLIQGQGYTFNGKATAYWPMGYPLFLAALYKIFGPHLYIAKAANVVIGSLTVGITYLLGNKLWGFWPGVIGALSLAFLPGYIEWTSVLCSEVLYTFLLITSIYIFVCKQPEQQKWYHPATSGLLLGTATIVRANSLLLPAIFILLYLIFGKSIKKGSTQAAIFLLAVALIIAPVTLRNYLVFHKFIPISTNSGINMWQGNNPHATGGYYWPSEPKDNPLMPYLDDELKRDQIARKLVIDFIRDNPIRFLKLVITKICLYYQRDTSALLFSLNPTYPPLPEALKSTITNLANEYYRIMMLVSIFGMAAYLYFRKSVRDWLPFLTIIGVILYFTALHSVFYAMDRYRFPIMPLFAVLSGIGCVAVITTMRTVSVSLWLLLFKNSLIRKI